jgi:hypothetical protein
VEQLDRQEQLELAHLVQRELQVLLVAPVELRAQPAFKERLALK